MAACPDVSAPPSRVWRRPIEVSQRRIEANRRHLTRAGSSVGSIARRAAQGQTSHA